MKLLICLMAFALLSLNINAEEIPINIEPSTEVDKSEVPVTATFNDNTGELVLKFGEAMFYDVAVLDASGVVYKERIDGASLFELRVNVHSRGGEPYTLVITDSDGCVYEGSFVA